MTLVRERKTTYYVVRFCGKNIFVYVHMFKRIFFNRVKDLFNLIEGLGRSVLILVVTKTKRNVDFGALRKITYYGSDFDLKTCLCVRIKCSSINSTITSIGLRAQVAVLQS